MKWFLNDASLQEQFGDHEELRSILRDLIALRQRNPDVRDNLRVTRSFPFASAAPGADVRHVVASERDRDLKRSLLAWLDRTGPFIDDDRAEEVDDYFEFCGVEVTASGLGEAARRTKNKEDSSTFSFAGGDVDFCSDPLDVDHGLKEDRLGQYQVANYVDLAALEADVVNSAPPVTSWAELVTAARERFGHLEIEDWHLTKALQKEPFESSLAERALILLEHLNSYVEDRDDNGSEGPIAKKVIDDYFKGKRAIFSGESATNLIEFKDEMTFDLGNGTTLFAPWHGKISHRYFRMHFEWPLAGDRKKLSVPYFGPKITKD